MTLLRLVSLQYFLKHKLRTVLTIAGIALGVAVFVGMHAANSSVLAAFRQTVDRIAGKTELQVTSGSNGFAEDVLEQVQSASSVAIAVPVIEAIVDSTTPGQGTLLILGTDMTGDGRLRDYDLDSDETQVDDPLLFLAQPDSIIVSQAFASRNRLALGSSLPLATAEGIKTFTVRGVTKASGLATAFGGNLAIMDIYAAQKAFGRGRTFDRIDLAAKEGTSLKECQEELSRLLGPGFEVQAPASRGEQFESTLVGYSTMMSASSVFALFIGMFIIYSSFVTAVAQRRSEIGVLRALGASRGEIRWLFLGESALIGLIGSALGVLAGLGIARFIAVYVSVLVSSVYFVAQETPQVTLAPQLLLIAFGLGVGTSLVAALVPAHAAARVDPVETLRKASFQVVASTESRVRLAVAAVVAAGALALLYGGRQQPLFFVSYGLAMLAPLLLGPLLTRAAAVALRPVLKWLRPVEGALAADGIVVSPRRMTPCIFALMLSTSLVIAFSGVASASYNSIVDWMNATFNPDLFISATSNFNVQTTRLPASMADELKAVPGVARVQMYRNGRVPFRGTTISIVAIEMASVAETAPRRPVEGSVDQMYRETAAGRGLIVSDSLAQLQHLRLGEIVEIPAPYGVIRLPIAGVIVDYTDQQGTVLLDRSVFLRYWRDDGVRDFRVYLAPGANLDQVKGAIQQRYAGIRQVFVLTSGDLKTYILKLTNQWFGLTSVQVLVAVFVALLGIFNALTVSIGDRRREFGVLRAVGAVHRQVRAAIWIEALSVALIGVLLGCALGSVNLYYLLRTMQQNLVGMRLDYAFPASALLWLIPTVLGAAFVAALWPAEAAIRSALVEALEYE